MKIKIDGTVYEVDKVYTGGYLPLLECGRLEFYVAADSESAGEAVKEYWRDMARNDPDEFAAIIGESRLVKWATGRNDEFGISNFEEFLEVAGKHPEEQWASYDGQERECEIVADWEGEPEPEFYECGICAEYHEWGFEGDCRDADFRLTLEQCEQQRPGAEVISADDLQARQEWTIETSELHDELGFIPTVAYRHN